MQMTFWPDLGARPLTGVHGCRKRPVPELAAMILELMPEGGVLISDNVLQDGDIVESRFAVERRNRTIHSRMRRYLYELKHRKGLETAIIHRDGVAVSTKYTERVE